MNISALTHYGRVIKTRRDDTCFTCGVATVAGRDFAAVTAAGKWHAYCVACAGSYASQVAGLVKRAEALATTVTIAEGTPMPDEDLLVAVIAGNSTPAQGYEAVMQMQCLLIVLNHTKVQASKAEAASDPLLDALRAIADDVNAVPRDRSFATSLLAGFDRYGSLTPNQRSAAERMVARGNAGPVATVEPGMYLGTDGSIRRAYMTQNDRLGVRLLHVHDNGDGTSTGSMEYEKGGTRTLGRMLAAGEARLLTQEEAAAFGKLHSFCCVCSIDLEDDRSLVAGYGPVCARNNDWWYPTAAEAREILDRPTGIEG